MLFSEPTFFAFFLAYFALHVAIPARYRPYLIIAGGTVFYAWWRPIYLWVPYGLSAVAYWGAAWMDRAPTEVVRRRRLVMALVTLLLPLVVVKYSYFVLTAVIGLAIDPTLIVTEPRQLRWALPLGISFITFTAAAYLVDVYRRRYARERSLGPMLAYVLFFPHLIAGPILRPHELIPQIKKLRRALDARFLTGIAIFTLGLVKKLVFADQIAPLVDRVYAAEQALSVWHYVFALYGFTAQIYCDFSGYTDMAIGLAYILCIRLPTNFLRPYGAVSVADFWRRWHITLSHWLRDYLYIPLGGSRLGWRRQIANLLITMGLGGLWHGANWTFVLWGLAHGAALGFVHALRRQRFLSGVNFPRWLSVALTLHFVALAWVLFRAPSLEVAGRIFAGLVAAPAEGSVAFLSQNLFPILLVALFFALHGLDRHARLRWIASHMNKSVLWVIMAAFWIIAVTVSQGSSAKFIYFDF
jgi:alginate O-acetyltransferase complex protein AlgI